MQAHFGELGGGSPFSQYLGFYWSDFDKQGLILKLRHSSDHKFAKFSCREPPGAANSRNFPVVKFSCFTVVNWELGFELKIDWELGLGTPHHDPHSRINTWSNIFRTI